MPQTIVIVGQPCSGKTTLAKALVEHGYEQILQYTTRPMREGEVDGVDYHFVSNEQFKQLFANDFFAEITTYNAVFGFCMYGSAKEDYQNGDKKVIVLNPEAVLQLDVPARLVYLDIPYEHLRRRVLKRGDDLKEFYRRYDTDKPKFDKMVSVKKPSIHVKRCSFENALVHRILRKTPSYSR